jgi:hypothetical protein
MCHSGWFSADSYQQLNTGLVVRAPAGARHAHPQDPAFMPGPTPARARVAARRHPLGPRNHHQPIIRSPARRGRALLAGHYPDPDDPVFDPSLSPRSPSRSLCAPSPIRSSQRSTRPPAALRRDQRGMHSYLRLRARTVVVASGLPDYACNGQVPSPGLDSLPRASSSFGANCPYRLPTSGDDCTSGQDLAASIVGSADRCCYASYCSS